MGGHRPEHRLVGEDLFLLTDTAELSPLDDAERKAAMQAELQEWQQGLTRHRQERTIVLSPESEEMLRLLGYVDP